MLNILKKFFEFSGTENRKKFYTAIVLGIVEALAQAFKIPAIFLMVQGMVEKILLPLRYGPPLEFCLAVW